MSSDDSHDASQSKDLVGQGLDSQVPAERSDEVAFYDERWAEFRFARRLKLIRCSAILDALSTLGFTEPRMLELGCGTGWLTSILGAFGPATGVDFSERAINMASKRYPNARFVCADIQIWKPEHNFDLVVSHEVVEHLEDQAQHIRKIVGALGDEGRLILTTPNRTTLESMPFGQRSTWSQQPLEKWLTRKELRSLLAENGMEVLSMGTVIPGFGGSPLRRIAGSRWIRKALELIGLRSTFEYLCCRLGLGLHTICVARTATPISRSSDRLRLRSTSPRSDASSSARTMKMTNPGVLQGLGR